MKICQTAQVEKLRTDMRCFFSCAEKEKYMVQDIIVIVFCVIAFGAALWGWWIDSGFGEKRKKTKGTEKIESADIKE